MIQRLLIFLALALILPDIYIYWMFIKRSLGNPLLKLLYWLPTLILVAVLAFVPFLVNETFMSEHTRWVGWFSILLFLFALPKLSFMLCSLIGLPFSYLLHWSRTPFICIGLTVAVLNAGVILYGSFIGKTHFEVKEIVFQSPRLPKSFNGYRIVQLSDLHIGSWEGNAAALRRAVEMVNAQQPDLIVFTGDLVNHKTAELEGFQSILADLKAKDGVYSILGNHDYGSYHPWKSKHEQAENLSDLQKQQSEMGWVLLNNSHRMLHQGNDSIALIGVENEGEPPFSQHGDLPKALQGTEGVFKLLLSHNPTHWRREVLPQSDVDLMLAGHTHAMQLAIGHHSPSSFVYPEWRGLYTEGNQSLYVNVGLGFVGLPFRFGARPEITVITLQR